MKEETDDARFKNRYRKTVEKYSKDRIKELVYILPKIPSKGSVLEVGCEPFAISKELIKKGYDFSGVDLNFEDKKLNILKCDVEREPLPFNDKSFDIILLMKTIDHLTRDLLFALREMNRVVKDDGTLVVTCGNFFSLGNIRDMLFKGKKNLFNQCFEGAKYITYATCYTKNELKELLDFCGFSVYHCSFFGKSFFGSRDNILCITKKSKEKV